MDLGWIWMVKFGNEKIKELFYKKYKIWALNKYI